MKFYLSHLFGLLLFSNGLLASSMAKQRLPDWLTEKLIEESIEYQATGTDEEKDQDYNFWLSKLVDQDCSLENFLRVFPKPIVVSHVFQSLDENQIEVRYIKDLNDLRNSTANDPCLMNTNSADCRQIKEHRINQFKNFFPRVIDHSSDEIVELGKRNTVLGKRTQLTAKPTLDNTEMDARVFPSPKRRHTSHTDNSCFVVDTYNTQNITSCKDFVIHCRAKTKLTIVQIFHILIDAKRNGELQNKNYPDGLLFEDYQELARTFCIGEMVKNKFPMEQMKKGMKEIHAQAYDFRDKLRRNYLSRARASGYIDKSETDYLKILHCDTDFHSSEKIKYFIDHYVGKNYENKEDILTGFSVKPSDLYSDFLLTKYSEATDGCHKKKYTGFRAQLVNLKKYIKNKKETGLSEEARAFIEHRITGI